MVYPATYPDPELAGRPKGMKVVLQERQSVWDVLMERHNGKVVGKCQRCQKSQAKRDTERRLTLAEALGQEAPETGELQTEDEPETDSEDNDWCCMYRVLSLQDDFVNEKPLIQHYIESRGHVCLFLPKFHCELNPIEMLWGYAKYRYRNVTDGKFSTAKTLVPQCLDMCDVLTIRRFFPQSLALHGCLPERTRCSTSSLRS